MALGISLVSSTETTLKVRATGFSDAVNVLNWYIDNAYDGSVSSNESGWPTWTFTGLSPSTTYTIKVAFFASSGGSMLDKVEADFTTKDKVIITGDVRCRRWFYCYAGNQWVYRWREDEYLNSGLTYTPIKHLSTSPEIDLSPYYLDSITSNIDGDTTDYSDGSSFICPSDNFSLYYNYKFDSSKVSITPWDWNSTNGGDATASETRAAYDAAMNHGPVKNFSYKVWNDLCAKMKRILELMNIDWDDLDLSYNSTLMTPTNRRLTAERFNSLKTNIYDYAERNGVPYVETGEVVVGEYFKKMTDALNAWIETI